VTGWKKRSFIGWESLASALFRVGMFMCLSLIVGLPAGAQEKSLAIGPQDLQGKSAHGQLTVSATVVSSVGIVIGPNGERVLVVANAPAGKDDLFWSTAAFRMLGSGAFAIDVAERTHIPCGVIPKPR
jgi:hypothetical protein